MCIFLLSMTVPSFPDFLKKTTHFSHSLELYRFLDQNQQEHVNINKKNINLWLYLHCILYIIFSIIIIINNNNLWLLRKNKKNIKSYIDVFSYTLQLSSIGDDFKRCQHKLFKKHSLLTRHKKNNIQNKL